MPNTFEQIKKIRRPIIEAKADKSVLSPATAKSILGSSYKPYHNNPNVMMWQKKGGFMLKPLEQKFWEIIKKYGFKEKSTHSTTTQNDTVSGGGKYVNADGVTAEPYHYYGNTQRDNSHSITFDFRGSKLEMTDAEINDYFTKKDKK